MKFLIVCLAIASCASAGLLPHQTYNTVKGQYHHGLVVVPKVQPAVVHSAVHHVGAEAVAPVLRSESHIHPDGQYSYAYETGNGINAQESGLAAKSVQGSYRYTSPEGTPIEITYVADENGYQAQGAHLPVAPETPAHVLRALDWIAAHPQKEEQVVHYVQPIVPVKHTAYTPFRFNKF